MGCDVFELPQFGADPRVEVAHKMRADLEALRIELWKEVQLPPDCAQEENY